MESVLRAIAQGEARRRRIGASAGGQGDAVGPVVPRESSPSWPRRRRVPTTRLRLAVAGARAADAAPARRRDPPAPAPQTARGPGGAQALRPPGRRPAPWSTSRPGPPDARVTVRCPDSFRTLEIWTYLEHPDAREERAHPVLSRSRRRARTGTGRCSRAEPRSARAVGQGGARGARGREPGACADALLVVSAVKDIARRQGDNNGGLAERGRPRGAAHPPAARREGGSAARRSSSRTSRSPGRSARSSRTSCPRGTATSSRTSSRSSRTSSATRSSSSARTTSASVSSTTSGSAARWRRTGCASPFRDIYEMRLQQAKERFRNINTDHGPHLPRERPAGRHPQDRLPGHLLADPDLVLRAASSRSGSRRSSSSSTSRSARATTSLWTPLDGQGASSSAASRALTGAAGRGAWTSRAARNTRDVMAASTPSRRTSGRSGGMKMADDLKTGREARRGGRRPHPPDDDGHPRRAPRCCPIQRVFRFPELVGSRMRMELAILLERDSLTKKQIGEETLLRHRRRRRGRAGRPARRQLPVPLRLPGLDA